WDNCSRAFADPASISAVFLAVVVTVGSAVIGQNTLGLALAVLMEKASKPVKAVTNTVVIAAWVLPEVVAGYLMYAFFYDQGTLDAILSALHLPQQDWLVNLPIMALCLPNSSPSPALSTLRFTAP